MRCRRWAIQHNIGSSSAAPTPIAQARTGKMANHGCKLFLAWHDGSSATHPQQPTKAVTHRGPQGRSKGQIPQRIGAQCDDVETQLKYASTRPSLSLAFPFFSVFCFFAGGAFCICAAPWPTPTSRRIWSVHSLASTA